MWVMVGLLACIVDPPEELQQSLRQPPGSLPNFQQATPQKPGEANLLANADNAESRPEGSLPNFQMTAPPEKPPMNIPLPDGVGNEPVPDLSSVAVYDRLTGEAGFIEYGLQCKINQGSLLCQRYQTSYPIEREEVDVEWHDVASEQDWRPVFQAVSLHHALNKAVKKQYGVSEGADLPGHELQSNKSNPKGIAMGDGKYLVCKWRGYKVMFRIQSGTESETSSQEQNADHYDYSEPRDDIIEHLPRWLNKQSASLKPEKVIHEVPQKKEFQLPMYAKGFFSISTNIRFSSCENDSILMAISQDNQLQEIHQFSKRNEVFRWQKGKSFVQVKDWQCGDKGMVKLLVRTP